MGCPKSSASSGLHWRSYEFGQGRELAAPIEVVYCYREMMKDDATKN
jgi:hypothetical protein